MKLKSIAAIALAVVLLAAETPARGDYDKPPIPNRFDDLQFPVFNSDHKNGALV